MEHDLVVLSTGFSPNIDSLQMFKNGQLEIDSHAYIQEIDEDIDPGKTSIDGVFVAGAASAPRDIPDSILHAGAAVAQTAAYIENGDDTMTDRRIGVYICYCGGNISDYVEVEKVREAISNDSGVVVAKTTMFACSDAAQEEMIEDIKSNKLDGLVVASCSPKLHLFTFRAMAERAGLTG